MRKHDLPHSSPIESYHFPRPGEGFEDKRNLSEKVITAMADVLLFLIFVILILSISGGGILAINL